MNLKAGITSVLFAALAPSLHAQGLPPGTDGTDIGTIAFYYSGLPESYLILASVCMSTESAAHVPRIDITPYDSSFEQLQCIIYSESGCAGDEYTLGPGSHQFNRRFLAGSFRCTLPEN
ncbi:uncharacterized protein BDV14DRAFT_183528 [Aspergillus stella-maris]|uniref:uncharacterized protein n=1 Tax=Aspergillus stella-maris TaxID=1810926 RepID=UPI003CCCEB30